MGGGKETPRQKMIGLMYLVLMALLAINTSKDVIESFVRIDEKLQISKATAYNGATALLNGIDGKLLPLKPETKENKESFDWFRRSEGLHNNSTDLINYIEKIKANVISQTEGLPMESVYGKYGNLDTSLQLRYTLQKDNYDAPTLHLGLSDPTKPLTEELHALTLQNKLAEYRDELIKKIQEAKNVTSESDRSQLVAAISDRFAFKNEKENGVDVTWVAFNFYHATLAATVSMLTSLQVDVANTEAEALRFFYDQVGGQEFKVNKIEPSILSNSFYVIKGDSIRGSLVMAAYDTTETPEAIFGEVDTIGPGQYAIKNPTMELKNGQKNFSMAANQTGTKVVTGLLKTKDGTGKEKFFPFKTTYTVAEPQATISASGMNVFYKGVKNPLEVSAAGIPSDKLSVSVSGVKIAKKGDGKFEITPGSGAPRTVTVTVMAEIEGKKQKMASQVYRVMPVPSPMPMTNSGIKSTTSSVTPGMIKSASKLIAKIDGFLLDEKYAPRPVITKFKVTVFRGAQPFEFRVNGANFSSDLISALKGIKKNDRVMFSEVFSKIPGQPEKAVSPIAFKVR